MKTKMTLNQMSLPFGEAKAELLSYDNRVKTFWTLAMLCLLAFVAYFYAINVTAHNVAQRGALEREAGNLTTEIASLEFQYIGLKDQVTIETAHGLGFKEVSNPLYVARGGNNSLSFNTVNR